MTFFRSSSSHDTDRPPTSSGDRSAHDAKGSRTPRLVRAWLAARGAHLEGLLVAFTAGITALKSLTVRFRRTLKLGTKSYPETRAAGTSIAGFRGG